MKKSDYTLVITETEEGKIKGNIVWDHPHASPRKSLLYITKSKSVVGVVLSNSAERIRVAAGGTNMSGWLEDRTCKAARQNMEAAVGSPIPVPLVFLDQETKAILVSTTVGGREIGFVDIF